MSDQLDWVGFRLHTGWVLQGQQYRKRQGKGLHSQVLVCYNFRTATSLLWQVYQYHLLWPAKVEVQMTCRLLRTAIYNCYSSSWIQSRRSGYSRCLKSQIATMRLLPHSSLAYLKEAQCTLLISMGACLLCSLWVLKASKLLFELSWKTYDTPRSFGHNSWVPNMLNTAMCIAACRPAGKAIIFHMESCYQWEFVKCRYYLQGLTLSKVEELIAEELAPTAERMSKLAAENRLAVITYICQTLPATASQLQSGSLGLHPFVWSRFLSITALTCYVTSLSATWLGSELHGKGMTSSCNGCLRWLPIEAVRCFQPQIWPAASPIFWCASRKLKEDLKALQDGAAAADKETHIDQDSQRLEEENRLFKANPIKPYLEVLASMEEAALKDGLPSMGNSVDTPKLFKCTGKVRLARRVWTWVDSKSC